MRQHGLSRWMGDGVDRGENSRVISKGVDSSQARVRLRGTSAELSVSALSFNLLIHRLVPLKDSMHSLWMEDVA
jgi:hypothetical protein